MLSDSKCVTRVSLVMNRRLSLEEGARMSGPPLESSRQSIGGSNNGMEGFLVTCAEFFKAGWTTLGSYLFAERPGRL